MGLEAVELVMEIEDAFDIKLTDEEATNAITVGDLYDCILAKIGKDRIGQCCATQKVFHVLRRSMVSVIGTDRKVIKPKTLTPKIIPKKDRRLLWQKLSEDMNFSMPPLKLPQWLMGIGWFLWFAIALFGWIILLGWNKWTLVAMLICYCFMYYKFFTWITLPLVVEIPQNCRTVGGLSKEIFAKNISKIEIISESDTWHFLVDTISDQFAIDRLEIHRQTRFVEDLNFG